MRVPWAGPLQPLRHSLRHAPTACRPSVLADRTASHALECGWTASLVAGFLAVQTARRLSGRAVNRADRSSGAQRVSWGLSAWINWRPMASSH
eukprot:1718449-Lingulodinium_polyedra.AAC.1